MQSMRKRILNERRDELKELTRVDLVNHIRDYHDQESLNVDEKGNKRDHQVGLMASVIEERNYEMTDNQYYTMIDNFTKVTVPAMKVVGVTFKNPDVANFKKSVVGENAGGQLKQYDIDYHLENEPDNPYDKNAVKVSVENEDGELEQIGYLQRDFVAKYQVEDGVIQGMMEDHSNGKFKNVSYNIALDTEKLALKTGEREVAKERENGPIQLTMDDLIGLDDEGLEL